jgi:dipeptidyl aminopeptidase/acylaminoacyl peptidase
MRKYVWLFSLVVLIILSTQVYAMKLHSPKIEAPYGSWVSQIQPNTIVSDAVRLGGGREIGGFIYFSELRPSQQGRTTLVRMNLDGSCEDLIPCQYNVRTTVHEYGGGSYLVADDSIYFSNFSDQQIYRRDSDGNISQITNEKNARFADGCIHNDLLFYVMELHGETVQNCLVAINRNGEVRRIAEGADFYSNPRVSPDGKHLVYYCWNHPNMPWDGGELRVADLNEDGSLGSTQLAAGGEFESICQPTWGPDGRLYYLSDRSGWWNLYCDGKSLYPMEAEIGFPQWCFGQSYYGFWGQDRIVFTYSRLGSDYLGVLHDGVFHQINVPFTSIYGISIYENHLYFVGSSFSIPPSLIQYDLSADTWKIVKKSREIEIPQAYFSRPEPIEFPSAGGRKAHAFYYAPTNPLYVGKTGELPPLLVLSHGGPTAHSNPGFNLEIQYWTSRGVAVVDVNYGGSSGYGREYRNLLKGQWGIVDVDDCTNAALYCAEMSLADRDRLCIAGGSAGGYTTLACLTFRDVFKAGASFFGVSDLEALVLDTHKFESRYLDGLVGPYPKARDLYLERSPIYHVEKIKCPIILLQGDEDKIVPPSQSEKMFQSLLNRGIPTAYLLFKNEQHGFRKSENIKRSLEAEAYFFSKIFGFELADRIEPVEILNL